MSSIADGSVIIQTSCESVPSTPSWFGEVALIVELLRKQGTLTNICERVRFARRRFGHYEVIDFLAVLFGYAISGERTLEAFYERLQPFAVPFMALFERDRLPARSTLSRFLAALTMEPVEALRSLFLDDLLARPLTKERKRGELLDRASVQWEVIDIDGTRQAARQRALPKTEDLPLAHRRLEEVCVPGYTGRKPERFVVRSWLMSRLNEKSHEELPALLEQLVQRQPDIEPMVELLIELPLATWAPGQGDNTGGKNEALLLTKLTTTTTNAASGATVTNVKGIHLTEIGWDVRDNGHCGAGAPRFNVVTSDNVTHFIGCASPAPITSVPVGPDANGFLWHKDRYDPATAFPPIAPADTVKSIAIIFDEGVDTGTDFKGWTFLDNIDINGTLIAQGAVG